MKYMCSSLIQTVTSRATKLLAISSSLLLGGSIVAFTVEIPAPVGDAIRHLQKSPDYSWNVTTDLPDAPVKVAPITGQTNTNGFSILETRAGGKTVQAVAKGSNRIVKIGSEWKTSSEIGDDRKAETIAAKNLLAAKSPTDELTLLLPKLDGMQDQSGGVFSGALKAGDAQSMLAEFFQGHGPGGFTPDIGNCSGSLRVEIKDGVLQKYVLSLSGTASLPFGDKDIRQTRTTTISNIGSTTMEVPKAAKTRL